MTKSICTDLRPVSNFLAKGFFATGFLITGFLSGCATQDTSDYAPEQYTNQFATDDCKFLGGLFKDQSLNASIPGAVKAELNGGGGGINDTVSEQSKDKFTFPWEKTQEAKVSQERAELRKAHKQKGCAN